MPQQPPLGNSSQTNLSATGQTSSQLIVNSPGTTPATPAASMKKDCSGCGNKTILTPQNTFYGFLMLFLVGLSTFLFVMWVQAKRTTISPALMAEPAMKETEYYLPQSKIITSKVALPTPKTRGTVSVEQALSSRRSRREFADVPVGLADLGQVLWAGQGITDESGHRAAPSAHSLYPYTLYVVVRNVAGLEPGLYQYLPETHELGDLKVANAGELLNEAEVQPGAQAAPAVIMMSAAYAKMLESFPDDPRGVTLLEGGHIGQNIYLQLEASNMSGVVMAGFDSDLIIEKLGLDEHEEIVYLIPFGARVQE